MKKPRRSAEGIYIVPLALPLSLESKRGQLEQTLVNAQSRIVKFAKRYGWRDLAMDSFFDRAEIFDTKEDFDKAIANLTRMPASTVFPKTYSAALEQGLLMAVSPELYAENYPEGIERDSYEKLLAHEIAHRLHIRILAGDEEAMGPIWFFEGFALYAAEQFKKSTLKPTTAEIQEILYSSERRSYRNYADVFRFFAERIAIAEMIQHAAKIGFQEWLLNLAPHALG